MPRAKADEQILREWYNKIYKYLKSKNEAVFVAVVCKETELNKGQLSKALQYGRRCFENGSITVWQTIMSGPAGLFIPKNTDEIKAWILQWTLDAKSRLTTMLPYMDYLMEKDPDAYYDFLSKCKTPDGDTEMRPFDVFNKCTNMFYVERNY